MDFCKKKIVQWCMWLNACWWNVCHNELNVRSAQNLCEFIECAKHYTHAQNMRPYNTWRVYGKNRHTHMHTFEYFERTYTVTRIPNAGSNTNWFARSVHMYCKFFCFSYKMENAILRLTDCELWYYYYYYSAFQMTISSAVNVLCMCAVFSLLHVCECLRM